MSDDEYIGWSRNLVKLMEVLCLFPLDEMLAMIQQAKRTGPVDQPNLAKLAETSLNKAETIVRLSLELANARIAARGTDQDLIRRNQAVARQFLANL